MRIIWSILLSKCFALEFFVQYYEVPINSIYYVWALSLIMAGTATYLYIAKELKENMRYRAAIQIWTKFSLGAICVIAVILCLLFSGHFSQRSALAAVAGTSAIYFGIRGFNAAHRRTLYSAFVWTLTAHLVTTLNDIQQLSLYSIAIILGITIPEIFVYLRKQNEISTALDNLNAPT